MEGAVTRWKQLCLASHTAPDPLLWIVIRSGSTAGQIMAEAQVVLLHV